MTRSWSCRRSAPVQRSLVAFHVQVTSDHVPPVTWVRGKNGLCCSEASRCLLLRPRKRFSHTGHAHQIDPPSPPKKSSSHLSHASAVNLIFHDATFNCRNGGNSGDSAIAEMAREVVIVFVEEPMCRKMGTGRGVTPYRLARSRPTTERNRNRPSCRPLGRIRTHYASVQRRPICYEVQVTLGYMP